MNNTYAEKIHDIAVETFQLMCYMFPMEDSEIAVEQTVSPENMIASLVRFEGAVEGGMELRVTPALFESMAVNMLGTDEASAGQKEGALCELLNIICGNVVPHLKQGEEICYLRQPWIAGPDDRPEVLFHGSKRESVTLHLDEGSAEIIVYFN